MSLDQRREQVSTQRLQIIDGALPYGRHLTRPITVLIEDDDGELIVSEPVFHMHAGGPTESEAIEAFKRILSGYVDVLESREETLAEALRDQLKYLRSIVAPA